MSEKSFKALAKHGSLVYQQPDLVAKWLRTREDKIIHVLLDDDFTSSNFVKYYFAHVLDVIDKDTGNFDKEKTHKELKEMFLDKEYELLGEFYHEDVQFRSLLQEKKHEFIHKVMAYFMEQGFQFEDPDVWKQRRYLR